MKGKKTDTEFVSEFIVDCAKREINNSYEIVQEAKNQISIIDQKIKEVESLKRVRSKLIDVINTLSIKVKDNTELKKALMFYQLSDLDFSQLMVRRVSDEPYDINLLQKKDAHLIKELLVSKILRRDGNVLVQGDEYQNFLNFLTLRVTNAI